MRKPYVARAGGLPYRVIEFFEQNPEEELSRVDVASKFGLAPSAVALGLDAAVKGGALAYEHNDDLTLVYRLPTQKGADKALAVPATTWPAEARPPAKRAAPQSPRPSEEQLSQLVVETGKPLPGRGLPRGFEKWAPLVGLLQEPDTSVALPAEWVSGLRRYLTTRNKRHKEANEPNRYTLGLDTEGKNRLWRTA